MRICSDFSITVNNPLPSREGILTNLGLGNVVTKLNLSSALHQLNVATESNTCLRRTHQYVYCDVVNYRTILNLQQFYFKRRWVLYVRIYLLLIVFVDFYKG